jgi:hypothetical protein
MPLIPVFVTDEEQTAVQWMARKKEIQPTALLTMALKGDLTKLVRLFADRRWEVRKRALETNPVLAEPVDAAADEP